MNPITFETWDEFDVTSLQKKLKTEFDVIKWAYTTYKDSIIYPCSFGAEGIVLIDMISKVNPTADIVFLDTNIHFKETYTVIEKIKKKYPTLNINLTQPELTLKEQSEQYGDKLWLRNPNQCCNLRKIKPLENALNNKAAWVSGPRREQSPTRTNLNFINKDERFKKIKICPLIHWTWDEIWSYIHLHNLPYNELHKRGYPSIGCSVCTSPATDPNDPRSGRWANQSKTECGLHQINGDSK